ITASGVFTSWATPAASSPMDESFSACVNCASSCIRSVMSSTRIMRPTATKLRVTSGAMAMLAMRTSPFGSTRRNLYSVCVPCSLSTLLNRATKSGGSTAESGCCSTSIRDFANMPSICVFQLSMRPSRSTAKTPTLIDSTMFFVKLFQALELRNLLLKAPVELRVLDRDADISGQRFQQLHIFARKKIAIVGAAQADHSNRPCAAAIAIGNAAGKVVIQVQPSRTPALRLRQTKHLLRIFEKDVVVRPWPVEVEEAHIQRSQIGRLKVGEPMRCSQIEVPRRRFAVPFGGEEDSNARPQQGLR